MAMRHTSNLWMDAEPELVERVARKLCEKHGSEIFGAEAITQNFLNTRWMMFETDARYCIEIIRGFDRGIEVENLEVPGYSK